VHGEVERDSPKVLRDALTLRRPSRQLRVDRSKYLRRNGVMTKQLHMSAPSSEPAKRKKNLSWVVFVLLVGCAAAFGFGFGGDASEGNLAQMRLKLSDGLQQSVAHAPNVLSPLLHR
jgi:hypothetical protein